MKFQPIHDLEMAASPENNDSAPRHWSTFRWLCYHTGQIAKGTAVVVGLVVIGEMGCLTKSMLGSRRKTEYRGQKTSTEIQPLNLAVGQVDSGIFSGKLQQENIRYSEPRITTDSSIEIADGAVDFDDHESSFTQSKDLETTSSRDLIAGSSVNIDSAFPATFQLSSLDGTNGFKIDGSVSDVYCATGDINGDGIPDIILGAQHDGPVGKSQAGSVFVIYGKAGMWDSTFSLTDLNGSNGFRIDGENAGDHFGYSVSSADINGDGIDDLIIGSPYPTGAAGKVYVIFGSRSTWNSVTSASDLIDGVKGFKITGEAANDDCGNSVSAVGDVNGDGIQDLIIGANTMGSGRGYVVFGSKSSPWSSPFLLSNLNGSNGFKLLGVTSYTGGDVRAAGDVNGDGVDDLIIGTNSDESSYVVFGKKSAWSATVSLGDLNGSDGFKLIGSGSSVSAAGDVNGDGFSDVIVGSYSAAISYLVFGKDQWDSMLLLTDLNGINGVKITGESNQVSVSGRGDLNGDGLSDLIIGSEVALSNKGRSYVIFGKQASWSSSIALTNLDGSNGFKIDGEVASQNSGVRVRNEGDVNNDGVDDIIIGTRDGEAYVIFGINTIPILTTNQLSLYEGQTLAITTSNLNANKGSSTNPSLLTFIITDLLHGRFEKVSAPETAIDHFTLEEVQTNQIQFVHDDSESAPSYLVAVSDGVTTISSVAATITFVPDIPVLTANSLTINEGQTKTITTSNINVSDPDTPASSLAITITSIQHGRFERISAAGIAIFNFTFEEIQNSQIRFVHDGSELPPSYFVTVSDGKTTTSPAAATITFTNVPDAPTLTANTLTLVEGQTITITASNLNVYDPDTGASYLTFTITDMQHGRFARIADVETEITTFTQQEVLNSEICFVHDGSRVSPSYLVSVSDGTSSTTEAAAVIHFSVIPILITNTLTIDEGQTVLITTNNLNIDDPDTAASSLNFLISLIQHGRFERVSATGTSIQTFTLQEILDSQIQFVHDGSETAPSYSVEVSDGTTTTSPATATITFTNVPDAPTLTTNALTIDQGETRIITTANLDASDPDTNEESLFFLITNLKYGYFKSLAPTTNFTLSAILSGQIKFIHNGSLNPPSYNVSVSDGVLTSPSASATIDFSPINRQPSSAGIFIGLGSTAILIALLGAGGSIGYVAYRQKKRRKMLMFSDIEGQTQNPLATIGRNVDLVMAAEKLTLEKEIGSGSFGRVYLARWGAMQVAVKEINLPGFEDQDIIKEFVKEADMMTKLHHQNVVTLHGISTPKTGCYYMVMEYMSKGSLQGILHNEDPLPWSLRLRIAYEISQGLLYLHQNNIMHRDLKSANILLEDKFTAKISDFGTSIAKQSEALHATLTKQAAGTPLWMAPELFGPDANYTRACDVYSFGIILWEIATGLTPYSRTYPDKFQRGIWGIIKLIKEGKREVILPSDGCPKDFENLMNRCWDPDPTKRPTIDKVSQELKRMSTVAVNSPGFFDNRRVSGRSGNAFELTPVTAAGFALTYNPLRNSGNMGNMYPTAFMPPPPPPPTQQIPGYRDQVAV